MGLLRRRGGGGGGGGDGGDGETEALTKDVTDEPPQPEPPLPLPEIDDAITEQVQEIMKSNLDIMKDIVMKIRNEKEYAKSMYKDCPRLQNLLEQNPDLRPVFEDPRLVRINFETVYKEAGGILPEDEDGNGSGSGSDDTKNKSWILWIANSPFFKVLKALLMIKKLVGCIAGGGIAAIGGIIAFMTDCCTNCCCEDAIQEIDIYDNDNNMDLEDLDGVDGGPLDPNAEALNQAAEYMEDPEVQEHMQRLLEDPDNLADAIENDSELRALRDSNPLCAELMQDPETMKILVDPDNLRALGEAPQMIELDFADPGGFTPETDFIDIEMGADGDYDGSGAFDGGDGSGDFDYGDNDNDDGFEGDDDDFEGDAEDEEAAWEEDYEMDAEGEDAEGDDNGDGEEEEEEEEDEGWEEDIEMEETELDADNQGEAAKGKGKGGNNKKSAAQEQAAKRGGMAGVIASIGVAATDVIASQIVGQVFGDIPLGDLMGGGGGDDINLGGLDEAGDMVNDDIADIAEDGVDEVKDGKDDLKGGMQNTGAELATENSMYDADGRKRFSGAGAGAVAAGAMVMGGAGAGAGAMLHARKRKVSEDNLAIPEGNKEEEDESDSDGFDSVNSNEDYDEFDDEENTKKEDEDGDDDDDDDKKKKKKRFGFGALKDIAAATATAAKETIASTFLGDDIGEMLVERMEESDSDSDDDDDDGKKKKGKGKKNKGTDVDNDNDDDDDDNESGDEFDDEVEKPKSKKRGLFRKR